MCNIFVPFVTLDFCRRIDERNTTNVDSNWLARVLANILFPVFLDPLTRYILGVISISSSPAKATDKAVSQEGGE